MVADDDFWEHNDEDDNDDDDINQISWDLRSLPQWPAQEIAAAMPRQPVEFDPFLKGLSPFQPLTPIALAPQKQTDALSELNKFIGRQTGMLV